MASRWDTWVERYKPVQNTIAQHRPEFMFETYGDEYQFIVETNEKEPRKVWTLTEGDSGRLYVTDGWLDGTWRRARTCTGTGATPCLMKSSQD